MAALPASLPPQTDLPALTAPVGELTIHDFVADSPLLEWQRGDALAARNRRAFIRYQEVQQMGLTGDIPAGPPADVPLVTRQRVSQFGLFVAATVGSLMGLMLVMTTKGCN